MRKSNGSAAFLLDRGMCPRMRPGDDPAKDSCVILNSGVDPFRPNMIQKIEFTSLWGFATLTCLSANFIALWGPERWVLLLLTSGLHMLAAE